MEGITQGQEEENKLQYNLHHILKKIQTDYRFGTACCKAEGAGFKSRVFCIQTYRLSLYVRVINY